MFRPPRGTTRRTRQVVSILIEEGLYTTMARMRVSSCASLRCRAHCTWQRWTGRSSSSRPWPEAVKQSFIRLGPTFVKIGQILSVRSDLIPAELAEALRSLQSEVPAAPFDEVRAVIESEVGKPLADAFTSFESEPIGAGSLAMVYRAELEDGTVVAVKVKRPGIEAGVREDLEILDWLAEQLERHVRESRPFRPFAIVEELKRYTLLELDFRNEAAVTAEVAEAFAERLDVVIPGIYHASQDLIIMDFIESFGIDDVEALAEHNIDGRALMRAGVEVVLAQMLEFGVFHGDPHPGNVRVTPTGRLVMLDFGIFGRLDEQLRRGCALMLWTLSRGDVQLTSFFLLRMATLEPDADVPGYRRAIEQRYRKWRGASLKEYSIAQLVYEEFSIGGQYGANLPAELLLLGKALVTIEGTAMALYPDMDLSEEIEPYLSQLRHKLFSVEHIREQVTRSLPMWWEVLERLPLAMAELVEQRITLPSSKALEVRESHASTRPLASIIGPAVLVLGGSYILGQRVGPMWQEVSVVGGVLVLLGLFIWLWAAIRGDLRR